MFKRHTFWLKTAIVLQILTAVIHSLSFLSSPVGKNETERQLLELMQTYQTDLGSGFHPTMSNLMAALSSCFAFLYLFAGVTNIHLLRKKVSNDILKGIVGINVLICGACFVVMAFLTFLAPIMLTGLVFVSLTMAYFFMKPEEQS